jgi:hypothetical protein
MRDSWFRGYIEGNAIIPQTKNVLVNTTMAALLRDAPSSWTEFGVAELSPAQLHDTGRYMSAMHEKFGLPIADVRHLKPTYETVPDDRLHQLWTHTRDYVYFSVLMYIRSCRLFSDRCDFDPRDGYRRNTVLIEHFFSCSESAESAFHFKSIIAAIRAAVFSARAKEIAFAYRSVFYQRSMPPSEPLLREIARVQVNHPEKTPRQALHDEFCDYVRAVAIRSVPALANNAWYRNCLDLERLVSSASTL